MLKKRSIIKEVGFDKSTESIPSNTVAISDTTASFPHVTTLRESYKSSLKVFTITKIISLKVFKKVGGVNKHLFVVKLWIRVVEGFFQSLVFCPEISNVSFWQGFIFKILEFSPFSNAV